MPTRLSILSDILFFPVVLFTALLHVVTKPLGVESTVSMLIAGGLFGLALIPLGLGSLTMAVLEAVIPGSAYALWRFVGLPFSVMYFVQTLILDNAHLKVTNADPHVPRNFLEQMSASFFNACVDYCPITCVPWSDKATLPPSEQYVFAVHPHGIHCLPLTQFTVQGGDFDKIFPGLVGKCVSGLAATVIFKLPLVRELFLLMGYVDASRAVASNVLKEGRSLFVCTGGEEESMLTAAGEDVVVLKKRKGFVRLALSHGAHLVPVFGVGNSDLYTTFSFMSKQRRWLQKTCGVALPIFHGRLYSPLPYQKPVKVIIGKPIPTPAPKVCGERPDDALVEEYHAKYIQALVELHAEHVKDRVLRIQ